MKPGDMVRLTKWAYPGMRQGDVGMVMEDQGEYVYLEVYTPTGMLQGMGSAKKEHLENFEGAEANRIRECAEKEKARQMQACLWQMQLVREAEEQAVEKTAREAGVSPELVETIVKLYNHFYRDPLP